MPDPTGTDESFAALEPGSVVYDEDEDLVGVVRGFTEDGVEVVPPDASERPDATDGAGPADGEKPGQTFGEGYLMWTCGECGEMGDLEDGMPEACPNCDAAKEALYRNRED